MNISDRVLGGFNVVQAFVHLFFAHFMKGLIISTPINIPANAPVVFAKKSNQSAVR